MNKKIFIVLAMTFVTFTYAKDASVKIISPVDGAKLMATAKNTINYEVMPGPRGDHVHIYVDNKDPIVLRQLKGNYTFEKLEAGNRDICVKVVDKGHTPIGVEKCINVKVE